MRVAVIGGGPAGLRAAEVAAAEGARVTVFEGKASVGRKFLVAGRGGLNLTKDEPPELFAQRYRDGAPAGGRWHEWIEAFGPAELRAWAAGLGIETMVASTGRVYPRELKAAPLLRRWVERLRRAGVTFAMHHRWLGFAADPPRALRFATPAGESVVESNATVLALGGASWPQTGSDGRWTSALEALGISVAPLQPANCGWEIAWPAEVLAAAEGQPLKSIAVRAGAREVKGELLVTRYGLEGGAIYQLGPELRAQAEPALVIDFKPTFTGAQLVAKLGPVTRRWAAEGQHRLRLSAAAAAILEHCGPGRPWRSAADFAAAVKSCALRLARPRPIAEAISSAGGVRWSEVDDTLMLHRAPGVFLAGEMLDWEAPTGGYLIQGCLATGSIAGRAAAAFRRG